MDTKEQCAGKSGNPEEAEITFQGKSEKERWGLPPVIHEIGGG